MTERKPHGMSWESWIDRQIREGIERGEFDHLPGTGKPLPGAGQQQDELWWVREKLRREEASFLPPTLALRKEVEEAKERIGAATGEAEVRRIVAAVNERIRHVNAHATTGPPTSLMPLDVEETVARWRHGR